MDGGRRRSCCLLLLLAVNAVSAQPQQESNPLTPVVKCEVYEATCANGDCINRQLVCDGKPDCMDGSDEHGCRPNSMCEPNEYQCDNRKCVLKTWRCDGEDDCGDGSDERDCNQGQENGPCRSYEWGCASGDQCIPRSFHCDGQNDCQDQSDEIGCSSPIIVVSPPPSVPVEATYTFVINCTATGIPTPEIVWRLNWGHVPEKCSMMSRELEGNLGYGELTCPDAQPADAGAYSCEAINTLGSCFAGSAGCGQPGQDAIVIVNGGGKMCGSGRFNSDAKDPEECLECFCFDETVSCTSADLYLSQLPPPAGIYQLVSVNPTDYSTTSLDMSFLSSTRSFGGQKFYLANTRSVEWDGTPYFGLPRSHIGNQLKSYGGYFRLKLTYQGEGSPKQDPLIIIQGGGQSISYYHEDRLRPGQGGNSILARFWPGYWYMGPNRGNLADRKTILRVLANIDMLLVRAQQLDSGPIDTIIEDIVMDTADVSNTGRGSASFVEQCLCPPGYTGLSCETCAPGYERTEAGRCERPSRSCPPGYYSNPAEGGECVVCPCPLTTPSNQFARGCYLDRDGQVTCECDAGYTGRRCGECSQGFSGDPTRPGGSCRPGPACNYPTGSYDQNPDPFTRQCRCRSGWVGAECRQAASSTTCQEFQFLSRESSAPGCTNCFCSGIPTGRRQTSCKPSQLYRDKERAVFMDDFLDFALVDAFLENYVNSSQMKLKNDEREIVFSDLRSLGEDSYYWTLPHQFLGNKLSSYGGYLEFTLYHDLGGPLRISAEETRDSNPFLEIMGNDIRLIHNQDQVASNMSHATFKVRIHEDDWTRVGGQPINREHMLMALAKLDHILIKATHSPAQTESGISNVSLDCGVARDTGGDLATAVEACDCPPGYKGLSCEECAPGYSRSPSGIYLGTCDPCQCNGKSTTCDPETGVCLDCRDYTVGDYCENCLSGYIKDPLSGGCVPGPGEISSCYCDPGGSLSSQCTESGQCTCKANVEGKNCDRCKPGTFNLDAANRDGCARCHCSGVTEECGDAHLYWSTMRLAMYDPDHGITIKDGQENILVSSDLINLHEDSYEISYRPSSDAVHYWSLPLRFTGNKVTAYGGNLTIIQRYSTRGGGRVIAEPAVIMRGRDGTVLEYAEDNLYRTPNQMDKQKVPLTEEGWFVTTRGRKQPATREDVLNVLSNIQSILVRASIESGMEETFLKKVMMDIAVPQMTGGPLATGMEECRCPRGYSGLSCESCSPSYYRSADGRCQKCPCNDLEDSCSLLPTGQVECQCRDGWSGDRCEVQVPGNGYPEPEVAEPFIITVREPNIQIVEVGNTVTFTCNAVPVISTSGQVRVVWAKENGQLPYGRSSDDARGLLIISAVRPEDSGTYICTATSGIYSSSKDVELTVEGGESSGAPQARIEPPYSQVTQGDRLDLECIVTGNPAPSVTWARRDGAPLPRSAASRGMRLIFMSVNKEDEGAYVCRAANSQGIVEATTQIYVRDDRPSQGGGGGGNAGGGGGGSGSGPGRNDIRIEPNNLVVMLGEPAVLSCIVPNRANVRMEWSRQEGELPYTAETSNSGVLTIRSAQPDNSGIYVCQVYDQLGSLLQNAQARLTVEAYRSPPTVRIQPEEQTIGQGGSAQIMCIASGDPAPSVVWSKHGDDMSPNVMISGQSLSIRNAAVSDRGMYICTVENVGGSARASAVLEVERREAPLIEIYPENSQTVTKGNSVLYQCRAVAGIPNPVITWARADGRPFQSNVEELSGGVIRINSLTGAEAGEYVCKARNEAGEAESSAFLVIQEVPTIQLRPSGSVTMKVGTELTLECLARGDPAPSVSWKKLGISPRQIGVSSPNYRIGQLTKEDEGTYACVAQNAAGQTEERVQIIVAEEDEYYPGGEYPGGQYPGGEYPGGQNPGDEYPNYGGGNRPGQERPEERPIYPGNNFEDGSGVGESDIEDNLSVGGNVRLECLTVGNMANLYAQWRRADGKRLPARHYQTAGILNLVNVEKEDEGEYVCEVVDDRGTVVYEISKNVFLKSPPRIRLNPAKQNVNPGDSPQVACLASGTQPIQITWFREDGQPLSPAVSQSRGLLTFRGISAREQGRYTCEAVNADGSAQSVAEVLVNDMMDPDPSYPESTQRLTVSTGTRVDLICPLPASRDLTFSRDGGIPLPRTSRLIRNMLRIEQVTENDAGRYYCTSNGRNHYLDLLVQPPFQCFAGEFECQDRGGCVPQAQLCDGEFDCIDGSDELICSFPKRSRRALQELQEIGYPITIVPLNSDPREGDYYELLCKVAPNVRDYEIKWTKVGRRMDSNIVVSRDRLRFISLTPANSGKYRCEVKTPNQTLSFEQLIVVGRY